MAGRLWAWVIVVAAAGAWQGACAARARLEVTADTSLQAHEREVEMNSGASSVIRIKAWQHFMLAKFDAEPVRRWRITSAKLYLHLARPQHMLWRVGISTITADWAEGRGRSEKVAGGCTFLRAVAPNRFWAGPDSDFTDVAFGNGGSFMRYARPREVGGGWLEIDVDPMLVAAMAQGGSYGLCISDEKGQTLFNNDVHSREQSQFRPYMIVEGLPSSGGGGPAIRDLRASPYAVAADFERGAARLTFTAPEPFAVSYELRARGRGGWTQVPRWMLPPPAEPGTLREIIFRGEPGEEYEFELRAVGAWTGLGPVARVRCRTSEAVARPEPLSAPPSVPCPTGEYAEGALVVRAYPGEVKVNPVDGQTLEGVAPAREIHLEAARNEVVAFRLAVGGRTPLRRVTVRLSELAGPGGASIASGAGRWYRQWCVKDGGKWWGEYAVPLRGPFDVPWDKNRIDGQKWQGVWCDLYVPKRAQPGTYSGRVLVRAGVDEIQVPVKLRVHQFVMPDRCSFEVDFNCYGPVYRSRSWAEYLRRERLYYAAAHEHRATLNPLGYTHSGHVYEGFAPELEGEGQAVRVRDWARWDQHYGPYLDGSAFTGYRAGVPVTHMYLPFHENWPLPISKHYHVRIDEKRYPAMIFAHARLAPPIEQAFDEQFKEGFKSVARQFAEHVRERGWLDTEFQCYTNNKHFYKDPKRGGRGTSWWCLDEPMCTDDFLAVRFFGVLFKDATGQAGPARMIYRGDISRPQWQRDFLDGITDLECVSGALWRYRRRLMDMQRRWGVRFWHYGTANPVRVSNLAAVRWALRAWAYGADGILPWNVIGGDSAYEQPAPTALLVPGDRFGLEGPVVSLRVKAFRRGQQDVELLMALARKRGWRRAQVQAAVGGLLARAGSEAVSMADANVDWERLSASELVLMRRAIYAALMQK